MMNTRTFGMTLIALCTLAGIAASPVRATEQVLQPSADSYVMNVSGAQDFNFGSDPVLSAFNFGSDQSSILLQFSLPNSKMAAASVRSARLRLWSTDWQGDFVNLSPTRIYALAQPWDEMSVSWLNRTSQVQWKSSGGDTVQRSTGDTLFAINTTGLRVPSGGASMIEWDVTNLVRLWMSGMLRNNGLRINADSGQFLFESRESPYTNLRPQLILEWGKN